MERVFFGCDGRPKVEGKFVIVEEITKASGPIAIPKGTSGKRAFLERKVKEYAPKDADAYSFGWRGMDSWITTENYEVERVEYFRIKEILGKEAGLIKLVDPKRGLSVDNVQEEEDKELIRRYEEMGYNVRLKKLRRDTPKNTVEVYIVLPDKITQKVGQ